MANSSGGNSGNRRPKGTGNRSSSARRSGSQPSATSTKQVVADAPETDEVTTKSADERARERLANKPSNKRGPAGSQARGGKPGQKGKKQHPQRSTGRIAAAVSSVVVAIFVVVIVLVSTLGSSPSSAQAYPYQPASSSLVHSVTTVPASSFTAAGTGAGTVSATNVITETPKQALLHETVNGKSLPMLVYVGAEGCPYCAAARWPLTIALSRFGTFTDLGQIKSSPTDVYANTNTLSYWKTKYTSPYLAFNSTEAMNNVPCPATGRPPGCTGGSWHDLQTPSPQVAQLQTTYNSCTYFVASSPGVCGGIPFLDWGGYYVSAGGLYQPSVITPGTAPSGPWSPYSWQQIEQFLTVPGSGQGQTILGAANFYTALICQMTGNNPGSVCNTAPVVDAAKLLKTEVSVVPKGSTR
jgi:hypothetical protein